MEDSKQQLVSANIRYALLQDLHRIYLSRKHKFLSIDLQDKEDTKNVWFELNQEMRDCLSDILTDTNVTGIRFYFLAYPDTQTTMQGETVPRNSIDSGQLTIGFVATALEEGTGRQIDYYEDHTIVPPMNHGELCPQVCS